MSNTLRIGNASAFWGDSPQAPYQLAKLQPNLDYITLDYLAEVSMSIMAIQKERDPDAGYAKDFIAVVKSLIPLWQQGSKLKIITNAGGLNPQACAEMCLKVLQGILSRPLRIAIVWGDDIYPILKQCPNDPLFRNLESDASLELISNQLVTANVYFGAQPIVKALQQGADIVITGRVADPSLTVAPCVHHFGWSWDAYDQLAGATIAGHLIECGTQVTGGISTHWLDIPNQVHLGFPYVEVSKDGSCVITKPQNTGGRVTIETVKEQLLYEIGDPNNYLSPDVTVSFLSLQLKQIDENRVSLTHAKGKPPPKTYKVSATYRDGFRTEGCLTIFGQDAPLKAKRCGEILLQRMRDAGCEPERSRIDCIGTGAVIPGVMKEELMRECVMRVAVADRSMEKLEFFTREIASLVTSGPQGVTGYTSGRPHIRPVFGYWPCLIETERAKPNVTIMEPL